jgi:hypothetical protein
MTPECAELDLIRLEHDWTWEQLAADMEKRGIKLSVRTLHYNIKRAPADVVPLDRTLYKIRQYLKLVKAAKARAGRRHRRRKNDPEAASA